MPEPPSAPPLEQMGAKPFSFYPPIVGVEHNEWLYQRTTWSEMLVLNTKSQAEVWIPRQYLGEVSKVDEPVMIVGLLKELEYKAGMVWPYERRVLAMPRAGHMPPSIEAQAPPVPRSAQRGGATNPESRIGRLILTVSLVGILACFVVVSVVRTGALRPKVIFTAKDQGFMELKREDGFFEVVQKLGPPKEDRWRPGDGELQFRLLVYPDRGYMAVLMGTERNAAHYIGCVDTNWRVVHSVEGPRGDSTLPLLRNLKPF